MRIVRAVVAGLACAAVLVGGGYAEASVEPAVRVGPWLLTGTTTWGSGVAGQGLTWVGRPGGATTLVTRGWASVPHDLRRAGWRHVGSPGSWAGRVIDAYEHRNGTTKLFTVTSVDGTRTDYVHPLVPHESWHNSFAAVAPGGRWFVSGEWGLIRRLLVFAVPPAAHGSGHRTATRTMRLATTITLSAPVRNVQGCSFVSPTRMLCSTNDQGTELFPVPRQLLAIDLAGALRGRPATGVPHLVGPLPGSTLCGPGAGAPGEVEGLTTGAHTLTVAINSPCSRQTQLLTFTDRASVVSDPDLPTRWVTGRVQYPARQASPARQRVSPGPARRRSRAPGCR